MSLRSRRDFLRSALAAGALLPSLRALAAPIAWSAYPFSLGVASGYPRADGAVLWTRLAPRPSESGGGVEQALIPVQWEVAEDEHFGKVVARGVSDAEAQWAHSVHVEVRGLAPWRWYHYRFHCGDATSVSGRLRTAPRADQAIDTLRFAAVSCQHFETGFYAAYRHMLDDALDLVLHLGDYIYESPTATRAVRRHARGEPFTLDDYRMHHAQYRSDDDLKAAHAAHAWLMVWDDHEVENDYAGAFSQNNDDPAWFLRRRANAYRAYYEHMPLPDAMRPFGAGMRIHTGVDYGPLLRFTLLDGRQYRTRQPCPPPGRGGSTTIENCAARLDEQASFLGPAQEQWFARELGNSRARWNIVGQQMLMAQSDSKRGAGEAFYSDAWDGYPAARRRVLSATAHSGARNPVFLGGDVHSFWVTDLKADYARADAPVLATEFVTTAVSSTPIPEALAAAIRDENPHIRYGCTGPRGYLRMRLSQDRLQADLRGLDDVTRADSACRTLASFAVDDGEVGARPL